MRMAFTLGLAIVLLLSAGASRSVRAQEAYCCLCASCGPTGACVRVDVGMMSGGLANVGKPCPQFCPTDCLGRSVLEEGICADQTDTECPRTDPAPTLSLSALAFCVAALGLYGVRRVRRS